MAYGVARGWDQKKVAGFANVSERTVRRRYKVPEFMARVEEIRRETFDAARGQLGGAVADSIATMIELRDTSERESIKLRAAQSIVQNSLNVQGIQELSARLRALEDDLEQQRSWYQSEDE
jgi:hypothetical protein